MQKTLLTLSLLAPLFYTSCTSDTTPTPSSQETTQLFKEAPTPNNISNEVSVSYDNSNTKIKSLGKLHIKSFMETMQPTLMGLMQSDSSYQTALGACTTLGQGMTNDYNNVSDVKIRRTALRYRNPINKPDETDVMVMERFLASQDFKEPLVINMGDHHRVYKALPVKQPCLACHGTNISADLRKTIISKYPQDMATDFNLGDFRGVVVAKIQN